MANPSLQIGNGKFAIKENDLLGYSSSGTRFFPIPITMTRATLGTKVNPSGLIENVELLGIDKVFNGDFATDLSGWSNANNYWQWTSQGAYFPESTTHNPLSQTLSNDADVILKFTFTLNIVTGTANVVYTKADGSTVQTQYTTSGTYTIYTVPVKANTTIGFSRYGGINTEFYVDNVSVKEVTRDGLARVDYTDGTGSLLVEPQRTNLAIHSEDFNQWTLGTNTELVSSNNLSPTGALNAYKYKSITTTGNTFVMKNIGVVSNNTAYTWSVYLRADNPSSITTGTLCQLNMTGGGQNASINVSELTTEWKRFSVTATSGVSSTAQCFLATDWNVNAEIEFWGAQLEEATYPTSYIKTQGSTVTRNQDQYSKTGISNLIGQTEGSIFLDITRDSLESYTQRVLTLSDGTTNNVIGIQLTAGNDITFYVENGGSNQVAITKSNATTSNVSAKIGIAYKANDFVLYIDGTQVGVDSSGSVSATSIIKFSNPVGSLQYVGRVSNLQLYKTRLTNTQLATLTT